MESKRDFKWLHFVSLRSDSTSVSLRSDSTSVSSPVPSYGGHSHYLVQLGLPRDDFWPTLSTVSKQF